MYLKADITLLTKVFLVKATVVPVVMYGCEWVLDHKEGWVLNNWCFRTVVLEKTLEIPLDCKEIRPIILSETNPKFSWEGLMLKLKLQYSGHLMWRANLLEKTLMLGNTEGKRRGWQRMRWLASITDSRDMNLSQVSETVKDREAWCSVVYGARSRLKWLNNNSFQRTQCAFHHTSHP